jgi:hypothetical protein
MAIPLPSNFNVIGSALPIDTRSIVSSFNDLNNISNKYSGMQVYVSNIKKLYYLEDLSENKWSSLSDIAYVTGDQTISGSKSFDSAINAPNLVYNTGNQIISGVKSFNSGINAPNLIYNTGNQIISGSKTFAKEIYAPNLFYSTGNQTISGIKTFENLTFFNQLNAADIDSLYLSGINVTIVDGDITLARRPYVNGSGVLLNGEAAGGGGGGGGGGGTVTTLPFSGNKNITRTDFPFNINVNATDVVSFLNEVFFPVKKSTMSFYDYTLKELGTSYNLQVSGFIYLNDEKTNTTFRNLSFYDKNNSLIYNNTYPSYGSFNYSNVNKTITGSDIITARVYVSPVDSNPYYIEDSNEINFEAPIYYGVGAPNLNQADIKSLYKQLELKSDKNFRFTTNNQKMYIAVPSGWGVFRSILDQNLLENIGGWTYTGVNFTLQDNSIYPYYVWQSIYTSSVTNFGLTFKF